MPRHQNRSWGMVLNWFQLILVVMKVLMPHCFKICGSAQL